MIVSGLLAIIWIFVNFIFSLLGNIISFPSGFLTSASSYISYAVSTGAGLLFFMIRYSTFMIAMDILFFIYAIEPLYHFIMWILRKLPFLDID